MIYGQRSKGGLHGTVNTKIDVVEAMLDLVGYHSQFDLSSISILEPSAGSGAFALPILHRLHASSIRFGFDFEAALQQVHFYELSPESVEILLSEVATFLTKLGIETPSEMVVVGDFLEAKAPKVDIVIGNPPYVRQEMIPLAQKLRYRAAFRTFSHRADLYFPFFEKGLSLLKPNGQLSFICSNRWLKNQAGRDLRKLVTGNYWLREWIDLETASAFEEEVLAYPGIFTIQNIQHAAETTFYLNKQVQDLPRICKKLLSPDDRRRLNGSEWFSNTESHVSGILPFASIESQGFQIGIGVATGCDRVFVSNEWGGKVEDELLLPLVMAGDLRKDAFHWHGHHLLNPYDKDGNLILKENFPKAKRYFEEHATTLRSRHVAEKFPEQWHRTIDKVKSGLVSMPKLLLPDISGNRFLFIDEGNYYPHHNLYYITGPSIDQLKVLATLLMSSMVRNQLAEVGNKMHGGYPRWQSQNLRKLYLPKISQFTSNLVEALLLAYDQKDFASIESLLCPESLSKNVERSPEMLLFSCF